MSVRIRLAKAGSKKKVLYRIVAADQRMPRDGRFLEKLGTYDPHTKAISLDKEAVQKWLDVGAQPSETMLKLLIKQGFALTAPVYPEKKKKEEPKAEVAAPAEESKEA